MDFGLSVFNCQIHITVRNYNVLKGVFNQESDEKDSWLPQIDPTILVVINFIFSLMTFTK